MGVVKAAYVRVYIEENINELYQKIKTQTSCAPTPRTARRPSRFERIINSGKFVAEKILFGLLPTRRPPARRRRDVCVRPVASLFFIIIKIPPSASGRAQDINLRLILVSGKTKEFVFSPVDSAGDIALHVYENWPEGDDRPSLCFIRKTFGDADRRCPLTANKSSISHVAQSGGRGIDESYAGLYECQPGSQSNRAVALHRRSSVNSPLTAYRESVVNRPMPPCGFSWVAQLHPEAIST
ncbi:Ubiquitin-like protein 3 [Eumeta japonica]|uniref:Ubiquitin-like protein 3 n=1 Tax=Eumeta variegata TaxID=151549 RepID=A0A4C1XJS0_EUMVA|nr:Ubiquitin-like protein 3 [Eumeta japonica]